MNIYEQAIEDIKKYKMCKQNCPTYILSSITGPTGPTGPQGEIGPIGEPGLQGAQGEVGPTGEAGPMGPTGPQGVQGLQGEIGPQGPPGEKGDVGPQGPTGEAGTSVTILGSYSSLDELQQKHPEGKPGDSYLIDSDLYVWSEENSKWVDVGVIKGPQGEQGPQGVRGPKGDVGPMGPQGDQGLQGVAGPKGDVGPTGPTGPVSVPTLFALTFNVDTPKEGIQVNPTDRIPLETEIYDSDKIFYVSDGNNTITIMKKGVYKVYFTVQACATGQTSGLDDSNVISIGFRRLEDPTVYAGNSVWGNKTTPTTVVGQGIINLTYPNQLFELVNLGRYPIYLKSPDVDTLNTQSSFISPLVSIMIEEIK